MGSEQTSPSGDRDPAVSARQDQHRLAGQPLLTGEGAQRGRASRSNLRPLRRPDHGRASQQAAPRSSALALADLIDSTRLPEPQPGEGGVDTPRLIARGDLLAALDRAAAGKVTIISAPAGSGKTSLLRAWADRPDRRHRHRRRTGATRPARRPAVLAGPAPRGPSCLRHNQRHGTAGCDTRLQCPDDGRQGALGARRPSAAASSWSSMICTS